MLRYILAPVLLGLTVLAFAEEKEKLYLDPIHVKVPSIATDRNVKIDYDIVYVRAGRAGDQVHKRFFTDFSQPVTMEPGADLMLLHPDGSEELLVEGGDGSVTDPFVSFDGNWVYYSHIHNLIKRNQWNPPKEGADIYKIHVKTRKIVKLTNQQISPNTGAANWSNDYRSPEPGTSYYEYGVYNMGPCPLPGGRIAFTSNRDGFRPAKGYPAVCLQLFTMDDRDSDIGDTEMPTNLEKIGHLNLAGALHPVPLADGRIMYSSLESQGARSEILWGIWTMNPDGTNWNPLVSAFDTGSAPNGFHFQTQLSNRQIVVEEYYNQNNSGFGAYALLEHPDQQNEGKPDKSIDAYNSYPAFTSANMDDQKGWRYGRYYNGKPRMYWMPFLPRNSVSLTPFTHGLEGPADRSILNDKTSPAVGKFTHPSGAPNNHLLTCYSPGPVNHQYTHLPQLDGGIYLIKDGKPIESPSEMRLIKNDPKYNECWPRAVVPYQRIYGIPEPALLPHYKNDGSLSKALPEGTPFGLVGTSSFYKRESYPNGAVPEGSVTATFTGKNNPWRGLDAFTSHGNQPPLNWHNQGADAGLYSNDDIHAVRILGMEPTTDRKGANSGRRYYNHAKERLRILGEIPLRKFNQGRQPLDPDGNPDTSLLAKIPADLGFTFQTLDKHGMVLNAAQTWHQLRPGEVRNNCGGCHAHSQKPTDFNLTAASKPDYKIWDLVHTTPLLTSVKHDVSKIQWDANNASGVRMLNHGPLNVEYQRDVRPILAKSCVQCHTSKNGREPKAKLDLDADDTWIQYEQVGKFPGTYYRLALDERAKFGYKPIGWDSWGYPNASRYIRMFQSRRSLLVWKIYGRRLDGFHNDDHPSESAPESGKLVFHGEEIDVQKNRAKFDLDFTGVTMPPSEAGCAPLSDEDRRTITRWIDLGCPIDLDYDPLHPERTGYGWMLDDQRPTLTVTVPQAHANAEVKRFLIGFHDSTSGILPGSLHVSLDRAVDGVPAGENLASRFKEISQGVREYMLTTPLPTRQEMNLTVRIADKQGNIATIERRFSVK